MGYFAKLDVSHIAHQICWAAAVRREALNLLSPEALTAAAGGAVAA
jgi:hypothetical protein